MIKLESDAFRPNETIPREFTGEGKDISPLLRWVGAPEGTRQFVVMMDAPDSVGEPWVHWLMYNIPGAVTALPAGVPATTLPPEPPGSAQGRNSWGRIGWGGPMPPQGGGLHQYLFTLFALDVELPLEPGLEKGEVLAAIEGHVIERGELIGTYQR